MADIQENLFKAMDIIVSKRLTGLAYNKTITATITDDSNASKGEYELTDGSTTFTAYSSDLTYREGNKVYVSVPNSDFTLQKNIVGKVVSEDSEYFTYVPPLENYIDITGNLTEDYGDFQNGESQWSLLANSENVLEKTIWKAEIPNGKDYKRLGIRAEFRSWLKTFNVNNGNYGLRLDVVTTVPQLKDDGESVDNHYYYSFYLDSDDMYGNPYVFEAFFKQEKLFDLSNLLGQITNLQLVFYQRCNFLDKTGKVIEHEEMIDNLFVANPYVSLGYDIDEFTEDTALLYTLDSDTYNNGLSADKNRKTLQLRWIHVGEAGDIYSIDSVNEIPEQARIHWYHYELKNPEAIDPLAGAFWTEITNSIDQLEVVVDPDTTEATQKYKVIIEYPSSAYLEYEVDNDDYLEKLRTNAVALEGNSAATEEDIESAWQIYNDYLASIMNKHTIYQSEILEFISAVPTYDKGTVDLINGLDIVCDEEGYNGVYLLYNTSNVIQNPVEATKLRTLRATYISLATGEEDLDTAESIIWKIPLGSNTMIYPPEQGKEFDVTDGVTSYWTSGGFAYIKRMSNNTDADAGDVRNLSAEQKFRIKDYFMESATNNIVYCYVVKNNVGYEAAYEMTFGPRGTNGTDYTFKMSFESDIPAVTKGDSAPIRVNLELYDFNNQEVSNFWVGGVSVSWYSSPGNGDIVFCDVAGNTLSTSKITITQPCFYIKFIRSTPTYYWILQANINANVTAATGMTELGNVWLETYLPVPYRDNSGITGIEGTTKIVYNSNGVSPDYYKEGYQLYEYNSLSGKNLLWNMSISDSTTNSKYYPAISGRYITVPSTYIEGISKLISVVCLDRSNNTVLWVQPILMYRDHYSSAMLNAWDGQLTIDENNGTILSTMIGAGKKESDNSYSGMVMGDVKDLIDNDMKIGFYGFNHGEQSFGWKVDGTGFIGKSGQGQIIFDGNHGTIKSGVWSNTNGQIGMEIDLDGSTATNAESTGSTFKMRGASGKFEVDTSRNSTKLVRISGKLNGEDRDLFIVSSESSSDGANGTDAVASSSSYYLQSLNFNANNKIGTRLDLQNGKLTSYGDYGRFELATNTDTFFRLSDASNNVLMLIKNSGDADGNGTTSRYYLQSSNFDSDQLEGTRLDLQNGKFTTYGTSGYVIIDSSSPTALLRIYGKSSSYTYKPLLHIGTSGYYLQSFDWTDSGTNGTKINLNNGTYISKGAGGTITMRSDTNNILNIKTSSGAVLMNVGTNNYYLRSANYSSGSGLNFNLVNGHIDAYNFKLTTTSSSGFMTIDSAGSYPINVNNKFTVGWDGTVHIRGTGKLIVDSGKIVSGGNGVEGAYYNFNEFGGTIGPWHIDPLGIWTGGTSITDATSKLGTDGTLKFRTEDMDFLLTKNTFRVYNYLETGTYPFLWLTPSGFSTFSSKDCYIVAGVNSNVGTSAPTGQNCNQVCLGAGGSTLELHANQFQALLSENTYLSLTPGSITICMDKKASTDDSVGIFVTDSRIGLLAANGVKLIISENGLEVIAPEDSSESKEDNNIGVTGTFKVRNAKLNHEDVTLKFRNGILTYSSEA